MKSAKVIVVLLCSWILSGCKSVPDQVMSLPQGFAERAVQYSFSKPNLAFRDDAWNQSIGPYQLSNMDLSGVSTQSQITSVGVHSKELSELMLQVIMRDHVNIDVKSSTQYQTQSKQSFSFDLQHPGHATLYTTCQLVALGIAEEATGGSSSGWKKSSEQAHYLACRLTRNGQVSALTLKQKAGAAQQFQFEHSPMSVQITPVAGNEGLGDFQSIIALRASGYLVTDDSQELAAIQFDESSSRVWIAQNLTQEQQHWLSAVLVSLQMYDWQRGLTGIGR